MENIIEVKNLSKKFKISHRSDGYLNLRESLNQIFKNPIKAIRQMRQKKEEFWALTDINFNVKKGETIGIIGANGAGKSTLLKILSQITPPTTGEIIMRGKAASLLEVGTGFNPELTGRENIFLNGAILGMTKQEMKDKFDKIVEFSGVDKFLDTPVKRYSSGMQVRLAFSVAAHLEPDILIVDEVLAVGDSEFQKKCLGKMDEVTKAEGRTILFVSHNMEAVKDLCAKSIYLKDGKVEMIGRTEDVIHKYTKYSKNTDFSKDLNKNRDPQSNQKIIITKVDLLNSLKEKINRFRCNDMINIQVKYSVADNSIKNFYFIIAIKNQQGEKIGYYNSEYQNKKIEINKEEKFNIRISDIPFNYGKYIISLELRNNKEIYDLLHEAQIFIVENSDLKQNRGLLKLAYEIFY